MPQYFTGNSPENAFAGGMMAGYDFIDRIKARNEQVRIQRVQEDRAAQAFEMQKEGFATQQEAAKLGIEDARADMAWEGKERKYTEQRRPVLQAQQDTLYSQTVESNALGIQATRGQIAEREALIAGRGAYADVLQSTRPGTLGAIGARGVQPPGTGTVLRAEAPAPATPPPPAAAPASPLDLRAKQAALDAQPGPLRRAFRSVKNAISEGAAGIGKGMGAPSEGEFWQRVADPEAAKVNPAVASVAANIRSNPLPHAADYLRDREKVRPEDRAALDYTMTQAATEQIGAITNEIKALGADGASQLKRTRLLGQLQQAQGVVNDLSKAMGKTVAAEVLPNGGTVSGNDPKVLPAVMKAAQNNQAAGVVPQVTEQELRLNATQLSRMTNPSRLTEKQLGQLSQAFRSGAINEATYNNWLQYGGPLAPAAPKVIPFGGGTGLVLYPNGQFAEVILSGGGKGKGKSGGGSDGGATFGQATEFIKDTLNARIKRGDLPDVVEGTGINEMGKMMLLLQRHAVQFEEQNPEIQIRDGDGEMSVEWMKDPYSALKVMNWYVDVLNGVDDPTETTDPIPDSEDAAAIIPTTPLVQ